jgi:hypothetical protein
MTEQRIAADEIAAIKARCEAATMGPWQSFVEGRDHTGGESFIRTGGLDDGSPDLYVAGGTIGDLEFIAHARQDPPRLLMEIERLRSALGDNGG